MLIKPFTKQREEIDDIDNITQKSRYIFIYRYDAPHSCSYSNIIGKFNGPTNMYDVYLVNDSQVDGVGFYVQKGVRLQNRNTYRGYAQNLLFPDGKINYDSVVTFMDGTYLNRIEPKLFRQDPEPLSIHSIDGLLCGGLAVTTLDDEITTRLGTDIIQPFPQFYNVEDQMWLSNKHKGLKVGDFVYDYSECPVYRFGDLVDKYTKIAIVDIPSKGGNLLEQELLPYAVDPNVKLNNGNVAYLEQLKGDITSIFIDVFATISRSVFSCIDVIVDLECVSFNVIPKNLKFNNLKKEDVERERLKIAYDVSEKLDNIIEITSDVPDELYMNNLCPNRLTIHVDNFNSLIRLTNIYQDIVLINKDGKAKKEHLGASGKVSSSDADDIVKVWAIGLD